MVGGQRSSPWRSTLSRCHDVLTLASWPERDNLKKDSESRAVLIKMETVVQWGRRQSEVRTLELHLRHYLLLSANPAPDGRETKPRKAAGIKQKGSLWLIEFRTKNVQCWEIMCQFFFLSFFKGLKKNNPSPASSCSFFQISTTGEVISHLHPGLSGGKSKKKGCQKAWTEPLLHKRGERNRKFCRVNSSF